MTRDGFAEAWRLAAERAIAFRSGIGERLQRPEADYGRMVKAFDAPTPASGTPVAEVVA